MNAIGFIGLGQMGGPMAQRLLAPDIQLHVHDSNPAAVEPFVAAGAIAHPTPASVADTAACIFACLPTAQISEHAALGPNGIASGHAVRFYAEMSTIGRTAIQRIATGLAERGITTLDTPVSGGPTGARAGTLAVMLAGPEAAQVVARPWLERIGGVVFAVGEEVGAAQMMKLVNNLMFTAIMAATFEGLVMGSKAGLDLQVMTDVLNASTGRNFVTSDIVPRTVLPGTFDFGAAVSILAKDASLGIAEAHTLGVPVWVSEQAAQLWQLATTQCAPGADMTRLLGLLQGWAGIETPPTR